MVKKIIQISDVHIRNLKRLDEMGEMIDKFIEDCRGYVEKYGTDGVRVCVCGDIFENHISVSNEAFACCSYFFRQLDSLGCKTYIIAGNHDYSSGNVQRLDSLSPVFGIGQFSNVIYLDKELGYESGCHVDDNVVFCLYSQFSDFDRPDIERMKVDYENLKYVGLVHGDVNGSMSYAGISTSRGIDPDVFIGLDFVLAGHIHKFQELKRNGVPIVYSSSMIQKDFGETVSQHGYVVWDVEKNSYQFIELPNPDRGFYKFEINSIEDIENDKEEILNL